ncbi:MAG: hypothetical protein QME51_00825 [Planctomycetota bacterium]|nr:hypothetical protein [Planctomycetota bacterium]
MNSLVNSILLGFILCVITAGCLIGQQNNGVVTAPHQQEAVKKGVTGVATNTVSDGLAFWGSYGKLVNDFISILWHVVFMAILIIVGTWLVRKYLPVLSLLPKMILSALVTAGIFLIRYLISAFFGSPVGEMIIDSVLGFGLSNWLYVAFVKKKLFKRD